jgi:hypothetical protein
MSFFIVPTVGSGTKGDPWRPKYITDLPLKWNAIDIFDAMVIAANTTAAQDSAIGANPDAILVPPLDATVAVAATKNAIEALGVPAHWITSGMTYRFVLRFICGMGQLLHRVEVILGTDITLTGNLDKTAAQLPVAVRNAILQACDELGIDRSSMDASTTLREALRIFGQQYIAANTVMLNGL